MPTHLRPHVALALYAYVIYMTVPMVSDCWAMHIAFEAERELFPTERRDLKAIQLLLTDIETLARKLYRDRPAVAR